MSLRYIILFVVCLVLAAIGIGQSFIALVLTLWGLS